MNRLRQIRALLRLALRSVLAAKRRNLLIGFLVFLPISVLTTAGLEQSAAVDSDGGEPAARVKLATADLYMTQFSEQTAVRFRASLQPDLEVDSSTGVGQPTVRLTRPLQDYLPTGSTVQVINPAAFPVSSATGTSVPFMYSVDALRGLAAGRYSLVEGRIPNAGEIALSRSVMKALKVDLGGEVKVPQSSAPVAVVGVYEDPLDLKHGDLAIVSDPEWVASGSIQSYADYYVRLAAPLSEDALRALNRAGYYVVTRSMVDDKAAIERGQDEDRQSNEGATFSSSVSDATVGLILLIGAALIVLLTSIGFSITAKRQRRSLGLLGAAGLTRTGQWASMTLQGLLVGVAAAALGVAVGVAVLLGFRSQWEFVAGHRFGPLRIPFLDLFVLMAIAAGATTIAATLAGWSVVRMDLRSALEQRPERRAGRKGRTLGLVASIVLMGVSVAFMTDSARSNDYYVLSFATPAFAIGACLLVPSLLRLMPVRGPSLFRMAARDLQRNSGRSSAATAGVMLSVIIVMVGAAVVSASDRNDRDDFRPDSFTNQVFFSLDSNAKSAPEMQALMAERTQQLESILGPAQVATRRNVVVNSCTASNTAACTSYVAPTYPDTSPCYSPSGTYLQSELDTRPLGCTNGLFNGVVLAADETDVRSYHRDFDPAWAIALAQGKALVPDPFSIDTDGNVRLDIAPSGSAPMLVKVPAVLTLTPLGNTPVLISPQTAKRIGGVVQNASQLVFTLNHVPTTDEMDKVRVLAATQQLTFVYTGGDYKAPERTLYWALPLVTALFAVLATLAVLGLTLVEQEPTLAAVAAAGATARYRRGLAAAHSGLLAAWGAVYGVIIATPAVLAFLYTGRWSHGEHQSMPWLALYPWLTAIMVLLAVPALSAAVAFLFTRSRLTVRRRE